MLQLRSANNRHEVTKGVRDPATIMDYWKPRLLKRQSLNSENAFSRIRTGTS